MNTDEISAWLNNTYPTRDWDQQCQRLIWNVIYRVMGYTSDSQMHTYPTATAARLASRIESTNALTAPAGAMHWWRNPAEGHVAVELGDGRVLMTGTPDALGAGGVMLGKNYGTTTVAAYTKAKGNPYLGWSRTNGANPTLIGLINRTRHNDAKQKVEDEMSKPIIAMKLDGGPMNTLGVMIEPDGTVTGLNKGQWEFWRDRVKCVPVECKNPGHWEYLMGVMEQRRKRSGVKLSQSDLDKITESIRDAVGGIKTVTAQDVADVLQITVKQ